MSVRAHVSGGLAAMALAGGALLAGATGAKADALPTPDAPHINSATVSGSETLVSITNPAPPSGGSVSNVFFADGKGINYNQFTIGGNPKTYGFPASEAPAGTAITAKATACIGNPDDGTQQCATSVLSKAVTVK